MAISPLPTAPSRSDDAAVFVTRADAWVAALALFTTEANAQASDVNATAATAIAAAATANSAATTAAAAASAALNSTGYSGSSATSLAFATGAASLTTQAGKSFATGDSVVLIRRSDVNVRLRGSVTTYNATTGALVVNVTAVDNPFAASGPASDWLVSHTAFEPESPAEAARVKGRRRLFYKELV